MNWDSPTDRLRLLERVGMDEYNRRHRNWRDSLIVTTVCGHAIRRINSQFGVLYTVGETGTAFMSLGQATAHARKLGVPAVSS